MFKRAAISVLCLTASSLAAQSPARRTNVPTRTGIVAGVPSADGVVTSFKGIPFAAPPVDSLRWRAPRPAAPWTGVRKADRFGPSCMQGSNTPFGPWTSEFLYVTPASEDCLYLNIWTAAKATERRPVLVYIYGGGFSSGSGDVPVYDGTRLAKKGLVVLTVNYRVGPLGFLAHPELTAESPVHAMGCSTRWPHWSGCATTSQHSAAIPLA